MLAFYVLGEKKERYCTSAANLELFDYFSTFDVWCWLIFMSEGNQYHEKI